MMEKLKEQLYNYQMQQIDYKLCMNTHQALVQECKAKLDQTNCKASDVEKVQLHLLRINMSDPDWCFHKECENSSCTALHLEMHKILMGMKPVMQFMNETTTRLHETAGRIVLHAARTNDVALLQEYICLAEQESELEYMFNETSQLTGKTGLHLAVEKGYIEIVKQLVPKMNRCFVGRLDVMGNSAYTIALQRREEEVMKEICQLIVAYM